MWSSFTVYCRKSRMCLQRGDCMANAFHSDRTEAQRRYEPLDIFRRNGVHKLSYFFNKGDLGLTIKTIIFANCDV